MSEYNYKSVLARLKSEKEKSGLTNEELSEKSGVPLGTLNKILSGDTKAPQLPAMMAIAAALGTSVDYLAYGRAASPTSPANTVETALLNGFRSLNVEGQDKVLAYIDDLNRAGIYKKHTESGMVSGGS
ncbi:MAG: helix-turn-helix transcriptional regulator [Acutalibacter sp.]|nr:helix-turn-helix transcriptional regulator [Acutalibacter sp.]